MENASKALIMVSSVLLGVMILSIAVYLFSTFADYSTNAYKEIENTQITNFNSQFLKHYGTTTYIKTNDNGKEIEVTENIKCTAHDIITIANLAQQNNKYYQVENLTDYDIKTYYVQVDIGNSNKTKKIEKWNENAKVNFIKENSNIEVETIQADGSIKKETKTKYYYISEYPIISEITKRVCYIKFSEL